MDNVYIKGMSSVTPWGINQDEISMISDQKELKIDILPSDYGWGKLDRLSKPIRLGCMSIGVALQNTGFTRPITLEGEDAEKTGLIVANSFSNLEAICALNEEAKKYGVQYVNPSIFPNTVLNIIAGQASIYFNIQGANITVSNGQTSGWKALMYAYDFLLSKQLDRVIICELKLRKPFEFEQWSEEVSVSEEIHTIVLERRLGSSDCIQVKMKSEKMNDFKNGEDQKEIQACEKESLRLLVTKAKALQQQHGLIEERLNVIENNERFSITMKKELRHL